MAATSRPATDMNALLTMTVENYYKSGVIHDGVFKSNPLFHELNKKGLKMQTSGGSKIQVNLMYGKNSTIESYDRYGLLNTAPQDGFTPAYYDWCQYAGTISIDGLSEAQNSGTPQIQKLLREKHKQLTMSYAEKMNEDMWDVEQVTTSHVTGNGGKNIISLPQIIQGDPTTAQDVGTIDQSAETWWANQTANSGTETSGTYVMLNGEMRSMYNDCSKGSGGAPDIMIANQDVFEAYEAGMDTKVRYEYTDKASVGFENIKFKGAKLFWDEHVPDPDGGYNWDNSSYAGTSGGAIYFLNSKNLDLVCMKGKDFAPLGFDSPTNQDARVGKWVFYGQLVSNNRRKLGVLEDITAPSA